MGFWWSYVGSFYSSAEGTASETVSQRAETVQTLESFVLLSAVGGESLDDMERLRQDKGLEVLVGYKPPALETARQWLDRFHNEELMSERPGQGSFLRCARGQVLPAESAGLAGLGEVNKRVVQAYMEGVKPEKEVTLDVDAHLVENSKVDAKYCYEGYNTTSV